MDPTWDLDRARDPELFAIVARAARRFLDELREFPSAQLVYGVGVAPRDLAYRGTFPPGGLAVPLLLVEAAAVGVRRLPTEERFPGSPPVLSWGDIPLTGPLERLGGWELPASTAIMAVTRLQPLRSVFPLIGGEAIRGGATLIRGTAGPLVRLPEGLAFMTAGHVTGTMPGARVERIRRRRLLRSTIREPLGRAVHATDPVDTPNHAGYDAAIVKPESGTRLMIRGRSVAELPASISAPWQATMIGAVSGTVPAVLIGALMQFGDTVRLWKNSWIMAPSGVAAQGDSGGAVIDAGGALLVMLVGGSAYPGSTAMDIQYVQDAESLERDWLNGIGSRFA